jgi:DNA-binding NtrC family response regulator
MTLRLAVIDDDPQNLKLIKFVLANEGLEIHVASDPESGIELIKRMHPQIVLLDLVMPGVQGMEMLERIVDFDPGIDVILMTGFYSTESAVEAIQKGATDYFPKPFSNEKLRQRIGQLAEDARRSNRGLTLINELMDNLEFEGMIGRSPLMMELFTKIRRIAPHFRTVLVTGPTGVGKELVSKALHQLSPVAKGPYVPFNCSSISDTLAESELFGHVKGAFTGADKDKAGLFEHANGGTVLLDEVGELPLAIQAKLLRVLQNQEFQRVGSPTPRKVDVRVVAATNRHLPEMVKRGTFREDLYFRLCPVELKVPSLAERPEDLLMLERHFVKVFAAQYNKPLTGLTRRAQTLLGRYSWPGNVRELESVIGHAGMMVESDVIDIRDLPDRLREQAASEPEKDSILSMEQMQSLHAKRVLEHTEGNKARAAEILGISRTHLYELLRRTNKEQSAEDGSNDESQAEVVSSESRDKN